MSLLYPLSYDIVEALQTPLHPPEEENERSSWNLSGLFIPMKCYHLAYSSVRILRLGLMLLSLKYNKDAGHGGIYL